MKKLVKLLQETLDSNEKATIPTVVENVVVETRFTLQAAERLKTMLAKLGKTNL
jgi:hypothetical protein